MKMIKKAQPKVKTANQFVAIGDQIAYQAPANHDGRGGWDLPPLQEMIVKKVNKFTFDAEDTLGNLCRLNIREDKFQVKL